MTFLKCGTYTFDALLFSSIPIKIPAVARAVYLFLGFFGNNTYARQPKGDALVRSGLNLRRASQGVLLPRMETAPVALDKIFGMGKNATENEWAYIGDPHVDSYEGEAWVDEIRLWVKKK